MPRLKLSLDGGALHAIIVQNDFRELTIDALQAIAEEHGLVPDGFRDRAYTQALHQALRSAIKGVRDSSGNRLYESIPVREAERVVQRYLPLELMERTDFLRAIDYRRSLSDANQRRANFLARYYNRHRRRPGEHQMLLPFPDAEDEQEEQGDLFSE